MRSGEAPLRSVGRTRRPPSAIVAATPAISSGVASTLPCPIAVDPTARSSPISPAAGIVERMAPASPGSSLKPNFSAVATSRSAPSCAPIGANTELQEWAKLSLQRPAARLAVGVLERDALEDRLRLHRVAPRPLGDARVERPGERDDLEHGAGRLRRGVGDPGEREHLAVARAQHRDAAEAARERLDGGALDVGVDRRAHGAARAWPPPRRSRAGPPAARRRACRPARCRTRAPARSGPRAPPSARRAAPARPPARAAPGRRAPRSPRRARRAPRAVPRPRPAACRRAPGSRRAAASSSRG